MKILGHNTNEIGDYLKNEYNNHEDLFRIPPIYAVRRLLSKLTSPNLGLSILGVTGAGKSCLYSYLEQCHKSNNRTYLLPSGIALPGGTGAPKTIKELKIKTKEGYIITINKGQDVTGDWVSGIYKGAVEHSDVIIYLIPSDKFMENFEDIRKKIFAQLYLVYIFILEKETNLKNKIEQLEGKTEKTKEDKKTLKTDKEKLKLGTHIYIIPTRKDKIPTITDNDIRDDFYNSQKKDEKFYNFLFGRDAKVKFLNMIEMVKDDKLNLKPLNEMRHKLFEEIVEIIKEQKSYYI